MFASIHLRRRVARLDPLVNLGLLKLPVPVAGFRIARCRTKATRRGRRRPERSGKDRSRLPVQDRQNDAVIVDEGQDFSGEYWTPKVDAGVFPTFVGMVRNNHFLQITMSVLLPSWMPTEKKSLCRLRIDQRDLHRVSLQACRQPERRPADPRWAVEASRRTQAAKSDMVGCGLPAALFKSSRTPRLLRWTPYKLERRGQVRQIHQSKL